MHHQQSAIFRQMVTGVAISLASCGVSGTVTSHGAEPSSSGAATSPINPFKKVPTLQPERTERGHTAAVERIEGRTLAEIKASLMSLDPDPVFNAFVDSILDNAPDKEVGKLVLMHLRDLSHILEGRTISYPIAKNDPLLGEDPSAYRVLIRPLASVIGLFPPAQAFDFGAPDTNFSRLKAISALQATLRANGAAVRAIARVDDVEIPDFDLTFIPQCCLFSRTGTIDPKTLGERYDSGFLAELASCMEKVDTLPTGFTSSATLLLNIAFILNDDPSRNLHAVTEPIFRNASALNQVSPDLGQSYLECLVSLEHRSLAEVTESSERLTRYAAGLIDNGSAHPSVAFQSLKELRGKLRIDDKVIDELLVLHRYTGFLQVSRLQDPSLDDPGLAGSGSGTGIQVLIAEAAAFVRDPTFADHSKVALFLFAGTDDSLLSGPIISHVRDQGYVIIPSEVFSGADVSRLCMSTSRIAKKPLDQVVLIAHHDSEAHGLGKGLALGVTSEPKWFETIDHGSFKALQREGTLPVANVDVKRPLEPWHPSAFGVSHLTRSQALFRPDDCAGIREATSPRTQFLMIGSLTAQGASEEIAERLCDETGGDVIGSTGEVSGVSLEFDNDFRVGRVLFGFHPPTLIGDDEEFPPFQEVKARWYGKSQK